MGSDEFPESCESYDFGGHRQIMAAGTTCRPLHRAVQRRAGGARRGSLEPDLLVVPRHRVQQQADERILEDDVQDVAGEQDERQLPEDAAPTDLGDDDTQEERQEGREHRHLVAPLLLVRDAVPAVDVCSQTDQADQAQTAAEQHPETEEERIDVEQELRDDQGLGKVRVVPTALRHG